MVIPRVFHRIWVGGAEPEWMARLADSWREHHPGWELRQWTDDTVPDLFPLHNQAVYDQAEVTAADHVGQLRADVLRLEILYRFGGVYIDADFEALRAIDSLLDGVDAFAAWEQQDKWVNNAILGCVPRHRFVGRLVDGLADHVDRHMGARPNVLTGPRFVTEVYRRCPGELTVFDQRLFYPYSHRDVARVAVDDTWPDAVAVHHWANKRRERGVGVAGGR